MFLAKHDLKKTRKLRQERRAKTFLCKVKIFLAQLKRESCLAQMAQNLSLRPILCPKTYDLSNGLPSYQMRQTKVNIEKMLGVYIWV